VWNNDGDTAWLVNPHGKRIDTCTYNGEEAQRPTADMGRFRRERIAACAGVTASGSQRLGEPPGA
jgi:hypothetical protein